jgi:hypothetical protein
MKMNPLIKSLFTILFLSIQSFYLYGQHNIIRCGNELLKQSHTHISGIQLNSQLFKVSNTFPDSITIPVVVHVIHNRANGTIGGVNNPNITDAQIISQIDVLNKDYQRKNVDTTNTPLIYKNIAANTKIKFCLANTDPNGKPSTGINRVYNNKSIYYYTDELLLKSLSYWPSNQYLNIWVCDLRGMTSSELLLGYAQAPGGPIIGLDPSDGEPTTDGVVIYYKVFGTTGELLPPFNQGRTTTHEVGHWLGLRHPWGDYESGDCNLSDYCDDTPTCTDAYNAQIITNCISIIQCSKRRMIDNYMDYSEDGCFNLFTLDQKARMWEVLMNSPSRSNLFNSIGCCTINYIASTPSYKTFEDQNLLSDEWTVFNANENSAYTKGFEIVNKGSNSNYSTVVVNDSIYLPNSKYYYQLTSPYTKLPSFQNTYLTFDFAYTKANAIAPLDSIVVEINAGCYPNWTTLTTLNSDQSLVTSNNYRYPFSPNNNEWKTINLSLEKYKGQTIQIRYTVYSKGGNYFYLDNILFTPQSNQLTFNIYPNPVVDDLHLQAIFNQQKTIDIKIYNAIGQLMYTSSHIGNNYLEIDIPVEFLSHALYFVSISDGESQQIKRFIKQ